MKTARRIQQATLHLAAASGYAGLTVDMIAEEAGISRRTFFNHYRNKQEALAGPQIHDFSQNHDWFVNSAGPLLPDLKRLIRETLSNASPERSTVHNIGLVLQDTPELQPVFSALIDNVACEYQSLLVRRLGEEQGVMCQLLARVVAHSIALSFREWAQGSDSTLNAIADMACEKLSAVAAAFGAPEA
ncbi:TetR/AcrR family transcriptional regulator [Roseicyclus sp. F158]|uniref:TetR/AcrR family transcriptional regulator n=1 Tax=Tropicimonas omnivorans TaxID=3075590 RepID=A0ABU3DKX5_9RHOB|nr:TetR/AcrR family transcriptional regulator [Roseicyclus sp. F158]MDT0684321.1 TetR/AcrR family transcriptional regulator [Roseicyclus sp. F158]